jgi:hypothetical protein
MGSTHRAAWQSCIALTEPFEAAVVAAAHSAESPMPKRASLPSMFPPGWPAAATGSAPSAVRRGFPACSAHIATTRQATNSTVIAASTAQPWRVSFTSRPNV